MSKGNINITSRTLLVYLILVLPFAIGIILQLFYIQYIKGNEYRALAKNLTIKEFRVKANRGNIYANDGSILATSEPKYDIFFDPTVPSDKIFYNNINVLANKISRLTGEPANRIKKRFVSARKAGVQFVKVAKKLNFSSYQQVKNFPVFKLGMFKGGLIVKYHTERAFPLGDVLKRTIGFSRGQANKAGLEGYYDKYLKGRDGMKKKQKIKSGVWRPLSDINDIDPEDGYDLVTNIQVDFQDIAHQELKKQLINYEADHGSVIIMDVETGAVKAMVNLGKTKNGDYEEIRNYAVYETMEPGSTFKVFSVMALLEDNYAQPESIVDTQDGKYKIYNKTVRDAHYGGFGKITLSQVIEKSSNVGIVKFVYENYNKQPQKFVNRMYGFGLHNQTGIDIKGEGKPIIPDPKNDNWSGISLPWMAYGYGVELTPLQILTYYNGIANDGKVMKPYLASEIKQFDKSIKKFKPQILNSSLASSNTIHEIQKMLRGVVLRGTGAEYVKSPYVDIAGKTGTAQADYWKGAKQYIASFVGYFPADHPRYSMIVVIHKPNPEKGYYGAQVAGSVFKKIAEYVYGKTPMEVHLAMEKTENTHKKADLILAKYKTVMPDLRGLPSKDALYILENLGLHVQLSGSGIVKEQSIKRGERIKKKQLVRLKLS